MLDTLITLNLWIYNVIGLVIAIPLIVSVLGTILIAPIAFFLRK